MQKSGATLEPANLRSGLNPKTGTARAPSRPDELADDARGGVPRGASFGSLHPPCIEFYANGAAMLRQKFRARHRRSIVSSRPIITGSSLGTKVSTGKRNRRRLDHILVEHSMIVGKLRDLLETHAAQGRRDKRAKSSPREVLRVAPRSGNLNLIHRNSEAQSSGIREHDFILG
jgi:hypothetical protein